MDKDMYGIIDETHFTLFYPRVCDESAPSLKEAMVEALEMLRGGAEKVAVVEAVYDEESGFVEGGLLISMTAEPALHVDDDDE